MASRLDPMFMYGRIMDLLEFDRLDNPNYLQVLLGSISYFPNPEEECLNLVELKAFTVNSRLSQGCPDDLLLVADQYTQALSDLVSTTIQDDDDIALADETLFITSCSLTPDYLRTQVDIDDEIRRHNAAVIRNCLIKTLFCVPFELYRILGDANDEHDIERTVPWSSVANDVCVRPVDRPGISGRPTYTFHRVNIIEPEDVNPDA